jgi:hypothetical protein
LLSVQQHSAADQWDNGISAFLIFPPFRGSIHGWSTTLQAEKSLLQILMKFFNLLTCSNLTIVLELNEPPTEMSITNIPSRLLSRQCVVFNISQPYRPPQPSAGILYFLQWTYTDMHLTSGSAFILVHVISTGPSSYSASETFSTFILMAWLPLPDVGFGSPQRSRSPIAEFVQLCKTITSLSIVAAQPHYMKQGMLSLLWLFFTTSDSWHLFYTSFFSTTFKNTTMFCLQLSETLQSVNFKMQETSWK